jgi:hypothetical protein
MSLKIVSWFFLLSRLEEGLTLQKGSIAAQNGRDFEILSILNE